MGLRKTSWQVVSDLIDKTQRVLGLVMRFGISNSGDIWCVSI